MADNWDDPDYKGEAQCSACEKDLPEDDFHARAYVEDLISLDTYRAGKNSKKSREKFEAAVGVIVDFTPVIGDIKGGVEAIADPTLTNIGAAIIGIVPGVGDFIGKGMKIGAKTPIGSLNSRLDIPGSSSKSINPPGTVGNTNYSGHAFDRMQRNGIMPTVVADTISNPIAIAKGYKGATISYSAKTNISVITNRSGKVISVHPGKNSGIKQ